MVFPASWPPSPKQHVALSGSRERLARCPGLSRTRSSIHLFPTEITQSCQVRLLEQKTALPGFPKEKCSSVNGDLGDPARFLLVKHCTRQGGAKKSWDCGGERGRESDALKKKKKETFEVGVFFQRFTSEHVLSLPVRKHYLFRSQLRPRVSGLLALNSSSKCYLMLKKFIPTL